MVSVINPNATSEAIKTNWKTYHIINIILLATATPLWFATPFLTRNPEANGWHKFFRISSISYALIASGTTLYLSHQLGKLKPKIDALNKRENAEFKHAVASDLYLAQGTNTAIAQLFLSDRQSSFSSESSESSDHDELPNPRVHREFGEQFGSSESSELGANSEVRGELTNELTNEPGELSPQANHYFEEVLEALESGKSESHIIKNVMGFKGEKYKQGKAILEEIKRFIELEDDN